MIYPILNTIAGELNDFMFQKWGSSANGTNEIVELNNIANSNDDKNDLQDKIIVTLIKAEEEATLKNGHFYAQREDEKTIKHNPAINLNLFLLFSITKKNYKEALQLLSDTILFFQSRKVFVGSLSNNSVQEERYKVSLELQNMPMAEIFELWSNLGNKQYPFVLYKARYIRLMDPTQFVAVPVIEKTRVVTDWKIQILTDF